MKLIIGLGNPGKNYQNTRHNVGFMTINQLAKKLDLNFKYSKKFQADIAQTKIKGDKVILIKPQNFINLSGQIVKNLISYYNIKVKDLLVISDDINLPLGEIRIRHRGKSGGHNGLQSIINYIKSENFSRIKIGVANLTGQPEIALRLNEISKKEFVLSNFNKAELKIINKVITATSGIIIKYLKNNIIEAHTFHI